MTYLNGIDENSILNGKHRLKNFAHHISEKHHNLHKKIQAKNKELAKKLGAGLKRFAKIGKNVEFKVFIKSLEKNVGGISVRLKLMYKLRPEETKKFLSHFGDWNKIKEAINKGDKHHKLQNISGLVSGDEGTGGSGGQAEQYAEAAKQSVGIIKKIIAYFKKHKKAKKGDDALVNKMEASVDADSTIKKEDENGKELPAVQDPENAAHEQGKAGGDFGKDNTGGFNFKNPLLIGGIAIVVLGGGYMLMKKK